MRAEFAAFRALVESVSELPDVDDLAVFDTQIMDGEVRPDIYAVVFDQTPRDSAYALDARRKQSIHTFPLMAVGSSPGEVRWVIEYTSQVLRRKRLEVAGRLSTPLRMIGTSSIARDPDAATVYTATPVWRCAFDRA
jgi:hypothetical protein